MATVHLTDRQWAFIQPLLPPPARTGRPRADDRRTVEGILYVLTTGCCWQDLPREYGAPTTVWHRLKRWGEAGVWEAERRLNAAAERMLATLVEASDPQQHGHAATNWTAPLLRTELSKRGWRASERTLCWMLHRLGSAGSDRSSCGDVLIQLRTIRE